MATVNDVCLLAAILSDLCDDTDTNLPRIHTFGTKTLLQMRRNFNSTLAVWMPPSCKLTTCHVTETAGIEAFV